MIDEGYITRHQCEGYINNMHDMMWSCFDRFIPDIVPNNIIEQYDFEDAHRAVVYVNLKLYHRGCGHNPGPN